MAGQKNSIITIRILIVSILAGWLMVVINTYMGLKTPFAEPGSILSAILCFLILRAFGQHISIHENNIGQTLASGAGSIGNMANVIPALFLLGYALSFVQVFVWVTFISLLGVFFAVPFRRQLIVKEHLVFPSGTACASVLKTLHGQGSGSKHQGITIGIAGLFGALVTWFRDGIGAFIPPFINIPATIAGIRLDSLYFSIQMSPFLLGIGILIGLRMALSMLAGALLFWLITPILLNHYGILQTIAYSEVKEWIRWPGITLLIVSGLVHVAFHLKTIATAFGSIKGIAEEFKEDQIISFKAWIIGLLILSAAIVIMLWLVVGIPLYFGIISILCSFILSLVALRIYGETDMNLAGPIGHITQFLFGAIVPGNAAATLGAGGLTEGAMSEAGDLMQDLKTGHLVGTPPKKQLHAQLIGVLTGCLAIVPVFFLLKNAYGLGSEMLPAPNAVTFSGLSKTLSEGFSSLPDGAWIGMIISAILGILLPLAAKSRIGFLLPSTTGLGVAALVPSDYSITIFIGAFIIWLVRIIFRPAPEKDLSLMAAPGLIAGESITGVIVAILVVLGIIKI